MIGLAQVTSDQRVVWIKPDGNLDLLASARQISLADKRQAQPQPRKRIGLIERNRFFKGRPCLCNFDPGQVGKPQHGLPSRRMRIEGHRFFRRIQRIVDLADRHLNFSQSRRHQRTFGIEPRRLLNRLQRKRQVKVCLMDIRERDARTGELRRGLNRGRGQAASAGLVVPNDGDDRLKRKHPTVSRRQPQRLFKIGLRVSHAADGKQKRCPIDVEPRIVYLVERVNFCKRISRIARLIAGNRLPHPRLPSGIGWIRRIQLKLPQTQNRRVIKCPRHGILRMDRREKRGRAARLCQRRGIFRQDNAARRIHRRHLTFEDGDEGRLLLRIDLHDKLCPVDVGVHERGLDGQPFWEPVEKKPAARQHFQQGRFGRTGKPDGRLLVEAEDHLVLKQQGAPAVGQGLHLIFRAITIVLPGGLPLCLPLGKRLHPPLGRNQRRHRLGAGRSRPTREGQEKKNKNKKRGHTPLLLQGGVGVVRSHHDRSNFGAGVVHPHHDRPNCLSRRER